MKRLLTLILSLAFTPPVFSATTWYVDNAASGANNGTSPTDAWTTTTNSAIWTSIAAGDTVLISGGASWAAPKEYPGMVAAKDGTAANPITIKVDGYVYFTNYFGFASKKYITLDGALSDSFDVPTDTTQMWQITNNIGLKIDPVSVAAPNNVPITTSSATGLRVLWVEVTGGGEMDVDANENHGIYFNCYDNTITNSEIAYCYIHHNSQDGMNVGSGNFDERVYDRLLVHHCVITENVDDGIQIGGKSGGLSAYNNWFGQKTDQGTAGHPDHIQVSVPDHIRIFNNYMENAWNSWVYFETHMQDEGGTNGHIQVVGNLVLNHREWEFATNGTYSAELEAHQQNYGIFIQAWRDPNKYTTQGTGVLQRQIFTNGNWYYGPATNVTMTDVVIANNTVYLQRSEAMLLSQSRQALDTDVPTDGVADLFVGVHHVNFENTILKNNLFIDCGWGIGGGSGGVWRVNHLDSDAWDISPPEGSHYTTNDVVVENNAVAGPVVVYNWQDTNYANASAFDAWTTFGGNKSGAASAVSVVSTNDLDFRLTATDTFAKDAGADLSALSATVSGITTDLYGNTRGADGTWDIGASEYTPSGLILHYTFEDDFSGGTITDQSGSGNNGWRAGYWGETTNWPTLLSVTNNEVTSNAGHFDYYWDGYDAYDRTGDYIVVTNIQAGAVTNLTVSLWAHYGTAHDSNGATASWTTDHNASLVDNGQYTVAGAWRLGRENFWTGAVSNNYTKLTIWKDTVDANRLQIAFPDYGGPNGDTGGMNQYAFTFDSGTIKLYYNGSLILTTNFAQTSLNLNTQTRWLGIGAWPHHGSTTRLPWLTNSAAITAGVDIDPWPNTFWFTGEMDNVRMYTNVLSESEVLANFNAEGVSGSSPEPPAGPTNTVTTATLTVTGTITVGP